MDSPTRTALATAPSMTQARPRAYRWIKTECGRAKYDALASRPGLWGRLRLAWFVLIAAVRDWPLPADEGRADQSDRADSET